MPYIPHLKIRILESLLSEDLPLSAKQLSTKLNVKSHNIGQQLNSYRMQGLVNRTKHYDIFNRSSKDFYYKITDKGKNRLNYYKKEMES